MGVFRNPSEIRQALTSGPNIPPFRAPAAQAARSCETSELDHGKSKGAMNPPKPTCFRCFYGKYPGFLGGQNLYFS